MWQHHILLTIQLLLALLQILHHKRLPRGNTALWSVKHVVFFHVFSDPGQLLNEILNGPLVNLQSPPSKTSPPPSLPGLPPQKE